MNVAALGPDISRTNTPFLWGTTRNYLGLSDTIDRQLDKSAGKWPDVQRFVGRLLFNGKRGILPDQDFVVTRSNKGLRFQSISLNSFPTVEFVLKDDSGEVSIKPKPAALNSVESEIHYTNFFWRLINANTVSLARSDDKLLFTLEVTDEMRNDWENNIEYRAKLFRKLGFIEFFFRTRFVVPEQIAWRDAVAIETVFRGLTEGEFTFPAGREFRVPLGTIDASGFNEPPFSRPGEWTYRLRDEIETIFEIGFHVGPRTIEAKRAKVGNPWTLSEINRGSPTPDITVIILDHRITCRFENYLDSKKLLRTNAKLNQFKKLLSKWDDDYLISLVDAPLASIPPDVAVEIVEGILQFHDFPDRFGVSDPLRRNGNWHLNLGLIYENRPSIWLDEVTVDARTGDVHFNHSIEELRHLGKIKATEAFESVS